MPVATAAAVTIAHRISLLSAMGWASTARRRREAARMVAEKVAAIVEASVAVQLEAVAQAPSLLRGRWRSAGRRVARAWRAPFEGRVRANARRLRRRRRR